METNLKSAKPEGYNEIYNDIKFLLDKAKAQAYKAVDNIRVQTYWQIGERIVRGELQHKERADYGKEVINRLSIDLKFDARLIYRMVQFYKLYPILSQVATQLSWSHYVELLAIEDREKRKKQFPHHIFKEKIYLQY